MGNGNVDVDDLVEQMFGFSGSGPKPEPPASAPSTTSAPEPATPATVEEAAQALADAVRAHTGRRRPVKVWKPVVAKALGVSRLYKKRYDAVLAKGVELGLFTIDDKSLSYSVLVVAPEPEPDPFDEEWEAIKAEQERRGAALAEQLRVPPPPPSIPPEDWDSPFYLDCGHMNWESDEANEAARAEGHCCAAGPKKQAANWRHVRGEHRRPLPKGARRTVGKGRMGGFPGLCADGEGYFIGGVSNDCRRENPKGPWCEVHKPEEVE